MVLAGALPVLVLVVVVGRTRRAEGVGVNVEGLANDVAVTPERLTQKPLRISVRPGREAKNMIVTLDGEAIAHQVDESAVVVVMPALPDGHHSLAFVLNGKVKSEVGLEVDSKPPLLEVPPVVDPVPMGEPYVLHATVEKGANVAAQGATVAVHDGQAELSFPTPPAAPVDVVATDQAGNRTTATTIIPVQYPGGHGVHVTASAWGSQRIRNTVLSLIDAKRIDQVELDIKDEGGIVGYDSKVQLAHQVGAVVNDFDLAAAIKLLHDKNVRVVGRIVAFRDPVLTKWAWDNGKHD